MRICQKTYFLCHTFQNLLSEQGF